MKSNRIILIVCFFVLQNLVVAYDQNGYQWNSPDISASFVPDGTLTNTLSNDVTSTHDLNSKMDAAFPQIPWRNEFSKALQVWSTVSPLNFHWVSDDGSQSGINGLAQGDARFGDIRFGGYQFSSGGLGAAAAPYPSTSGGDVFVNTKVNWSSQYNSSGYPENALLFTMLIHEVGHALGLEHSKDNSAVMYPYVSRAFQNFSANDIASIQEIYGTRLPDSFDSISSNYSMTFASQLNLTNGVFSGSMDLTSSSDIDYYRIVIPENSKGTATVSADATRFSQLSASLSLFDANGGILYQTISSPGQKAQISAENLTSLGVYFIRVEKGADGTYGIGGYKLNVSVSTSTTTQKDINAPSVPVNLAGMLVTNPMWDRSRFKISWNPSTDNVVVAGYHIYRDGIKLLSTRDNFFIDSNLPAETYYSYQVAAFDNVNNTSVLSSSLKLRTGDVDRISPTAVITSPVNGTTVSGANVIVQYTNSDNIGVTSVIVYVDGVDYRMVNQDLSSFTFDATKFTNGNHILTLKASDAFRNSTVSAPVTLVVSGNPDVVLPLAPWALNVSAVFNTSRIDLNWIDNSANESGFKIERSVDNVNFSLVASVASNVTTYSDLNLTSSTKYYYRVQSYNSAGNSAYSNTGSATPYST